MTSPWRTTMCATLPFARSSVYSHRTVRSKYGCHRYQTTTSRPTWAECLRDGDRTDGTFDGIGIELDAAILEEAAKGRPTSERIADRFGKLAALRDTRQLRLQPLPQRDDQGTCFGLANGNPLCGWLSPDRLIDGIDPGDATDRFTGDRRAGRLVDIVELASGVRPAGGEHNPVAGQLLEAGIAVYV